MQTFGYHGEVLHLDMARRTSWVEEPPANFWRIYGGGGLLTTYYLLRECPRGIDAFSPANLLILTSSVVAGHPYAGLRTLTAGGQETTDRRHRQEGAWARSGMRSREAVSMP